MRCGDRRENKVFCHREHGVRRESKRHRAMVVCGGWEGFGKLKDLWHP